MTRPRQLLDIDCGVIGLGGRYYGLGLAAGREWTATTSKCGINVQEAANVRRQRTSGTGRVSVRARYEAFFPVSLASLIGACWALGDTVNALWELGLEMAKCIATFVGCSWSITMAWGSWRKAYTR